MSRSRTLGFSKDHCRICNRDFGVFLDIFRSLENRQYYKEIEECLSVKVSKQDNVSLKVCHRCVYNLKLCSEFVDQFNTNHHQLKTCPVIGGLCYFCLRNNCVLFDIETHADEGKCTVCKIEKCFSSKVPTGLNASCKLCLSCAYRLDILYELRETAFKTQSLHVKTVAKKSLKAVQEKHTNSRNNHLSHVKNYGSANSPKSNIEIHDISDKRSVKEIKMGTRKNKSGKKVTEGHLQCSIKLIDVMKVNRSKRKRSESSDDANVEKFLKVDDQQMKPSRVATTRSKSETPIKRETRSPRRTPEKTHTQTSMRTPVKSITVSPRRTPVRNSPRSPRRTPVRNSPRSPRRTPVRISPRSPGRTPVKNNNQSPVVKSTKSRPLTPRRTPVKTNIESRKKTPERPRINSLEKLEGRRNSQTKKVKAKLKVKITSTLGSKALKEKFGKTTPLAKSRSVKTKKAASRKNSTKFNCSVCNDTFSKKVNMKMHELSHQSKMPMLILRRCGDVPNIKSEVGEVNVKKKKFPEASSSQGEDQRASIPEVVDKEQVENMDVCKDDLSESKSLEKVTKEKESESVENENSTNNEISENNEDEEQVQLDVIETSAVQESDSREKSREDVNATQKDYSKGNENELNPKEEKSAEINTNNNEKSTSCGEKDSVNEDNTQTAVKTEINNSLEEQTEEESNEEEDEEITDTNDTVEVGESEKLNEERTDANETVEIGESEKLDEERTDANETVEVGESEKLDVDVIEENADSVESKGEVGSVATSPEEDVAKGTNEEEEATNTQDKDKIDEGEEQSMNNV